MSTFFSRTSADSARKQDGNANAAHSLRLSELSPGEYGRVVSYRPGPSLIRGALLSMGLTPGTVFQIIRIAPLGDPVEIRVRGSSLTLRDGEAAVLQIERADP